MYHHIHVPDHLHASELCYQLRKAGFCDFNLLPESQQAGYAVCVCLNSPAERQCARAIAEECGGRLDDYPLLGRAPQRRASQRVSRLINLKVTDAGRVQRPAVASNEIS